MCSVDDVVCMVCCQCWFTIIGGLMMSSVWFGGCREAMLIA